MVSGLAVVAVIVEGVVEPMLLGNTVSIGSPAGTMQEQVISPRRC